LGKQWFTKFDVRWGYNNVRIKEGDEWKVAFKTSDGLFEPTVMFFGLTNSPATFQTMMDDELKDYVDRGEGSVYMDDIVIHTDGTEEEHGSSHPPMADTISSIRPVPQPEKCHFSSTRGRIPRHDRRQWTSTHDPVKVQGIAQWPTPSCVKDVRSFLASATFTEPLSLTSPTSHARSRPHL